jgi:thiamine biosynthesis lipoprotein
MRQLLIALCLVLLVSCGHEPLYQSQTYVFGTLVDISIYGENDDRARELADHVEHEFQRLHESLHAWKTGSDLDRLNTAFASGKPADVSPELEKLITGATAVANQSNDLFNPAIGHLIQLWGFQRDEFLPVNPSTAEIEKWVTANPRMADITIHDHQASSLNSAVKLDLGGYAKGYALDIASAYLRQNKVHGALINIGGNIIAIGSHGQRPWRVGIQHPRQPGPIATLELPDGWAIGTSGDYQRFFERDGHRYCHIIDPRSGAPVQGVQAVTVLIPPGPNAGALSDAASKPLFISGASHWQAAAKQLGLEYALLIDASGKMQLTPGMQRRINLEKPDAASH